MRRLTIISIALLGGLTLCGAAQAGDPSQDTTNIGYSGLKAGIDPSTGRLRPLSGAESRQLDIKVAANPRLKLVNRQQVPATRKSIAGGGVSVKVPVEVMSSIMATRRADGTIVLSEDGQQELPNE